MKIRSYTIGQQIADIDIDMKRGWISRDSMAKKKRLEKEMYDLDVEIERVKGDHILYSDLLISFLHDLHQCQLKLEELESKIEKE